MEAFLTTYIGTESAHMFVTIFTYLYFFSPLWFPIILISLFWQIWVTYVRMAFFAKQKYILLEVRLPKEILKTPLAMETFLTSLHLTNAESTAYAKYWIGSTRAWFSLELVSLGGAVKFFIWTRANMKSFIESQLYAQYPGIEVSEAPDYAEGFTYEKNRTIDMFGGMFELVKPDPYPIKTYVDYGLDKEQDEENKVDPIAPVLEFLGSINKDENIWIQIIIRAHKKEKHKAGTWFEKQDWTADAKKEVAKILKEAQLKTDDKENPTVLKLTKGQQDSISAIERSVGKLAFDCGIRALYIAPAGKFNPMNIPGLLGSFKQYNSASLNGFKPKDTTDVDYPWQDYRGRVVDRMKHELLEGYKSRSYFYAPHIHKSFVLNSEELATIYHFPGSVAQAPSFTRIASKKSEAPSNLPI